MKTLCLIRHTRPDIAPGICYGQLDVDVAGNFESDAATVRDAYPGSDLIIASPLTRTRKLAEFLEPGGNIAYDTRLMEKHFGSWEGVPWELIAKGEIDAWADDLMAYSPPSGESAIQLMDRIRSLLLDIAQLPQQRIALVAHGGSIRAILAQLADIPLADTLRWEIDCGSVIHARL